MSKVSAPRVSSTFRRRRELHADPQAAVRHIAEGDLGAVLLGDLLHDRQAQPGAAGRRVGGAEKALAQKAVARM